MSCQVLVKLGVTFTGVVTEVTEVTLLITLFPYQPTHSSQIVLAICNVL